MYNNFSHYEIANYYLLPNCIAVLRVLWHITSKHENFNDCITVKTVQCMHYSLFFCNNLVKIKGIISSSIPMGNQELDI